MRKNSLYINLGDQLQIPIVQHVFIEPTSFCDDYSEQPCVVLPAYSGQPAMVSPAFTKPTMKSAPGGNTGDCEFFAGQNVVRRVHKPLTICLFEPKH